MAENMMNSAHKATNENYRNNYDSIKWNHKRDEPLMFGMNSGSSEGCCLQCRTKDGKVIKLEKYEPETMVPPNVFGCEGDPNLNKGK